MYQTLQLKASSLATAAVVWGMLLSPAIAEARRLVHVEQRELLLALLRTRVAVKPLARAVPAPASPVRIVEIVIERLRIELCEGYPLQYPLDSVFAPDQLAEAKLVGCNEIIPNE